MPQPEAPSLPARLRAGCAIAPAPLTIRRAIAAGLAAAGLYAGSLGPPGALAQDPTPQAGNSVVETATASPEPSVEPTPTTAPGPALTPDAVLPPAEPAATAPAGTAEAVPVSSPEPVPTALPSPTPVPGDAPAMDVDAETDVDDFVIDVEADPSGSDRRRGGRDRSAASCRFDLDGSEGRRSGKRPASTSARACVIQGVDELADRLSRRRGERTDKPAPAFRPDGVPTADNPTVSLASPGPAPIGVPNFFIEKFRIPPFLLPIYQAAGTQYGIRWEVLAAINEIETDYGRNLNVSSAGALGWMQFMPATWRAYGVDANKDGVKDPYNPVDAIFAAARYLKAAGAQQDLRRGIFAYNHADWYVDSVLLRARMIGGLPAGLVGSLTGLTQARFPVQARSRYAGSLDTRAAAARRMKAGQNAAVPVQGAAGRTSIDIFARRGAPAIAVNDGRIVGLGQSRRLGRYIRLKDAYGNVYTYSHLGRVATTYPSPRERVVSRREVARELDLPKPVRAASSTSRADVAARESRRGSRSRGRAGSSRAGRDGISAAERRRAPAMRAKDRLFANPARARARAAGSRLQIAEAAYRPVPGAILKLNPRDYDAKAMRKGARVLAGTILGRLGRTSKRTAPHVRFEIRPAGRGAPRIDPKPILDGWKLLESTEIYRAAGKNPFFGPDAQEPTIGQILLMSKEALQRRVLANPRIDVYECGRRDIRVGLIDRRVLATLEFLAASGLRPTVTSLQCGHGFYTASGNVSAHSSGNAVDIAAVNGVVIAPATQGAGTVTEMTIQRLLTLQGTMKPNQIISLMKFPDADNTLSMGDHHDHIHVGFQPLYAADSAAARRANAVLKPAQWIKLIDRLGHIDNPEVRATPSKHALETHRRVAAD